MSFRETPAQRQRRAALKRIELHGITPLVSPCTLRVVGVSFVPHYPENLHELRDVWDQCWHREERLPVVLRRNPANPHDASAVEVHVPALGERGFIGHLTSPLAKRMAPELDEGIRWECWVEHVLIAPEHMDRPGITIRARRLAPEEL